jgi:hypothetical protein
MDAWVWVVIAIVVVALIALALVLLQRRNQRARLKERFGPEYDRAVERADSPREAEGQLREVADRREQLDIRPLSPEAQRRYSAQWESIQRDFVDLPRQAVVDADDLIRVVMTERGYPVDRFDSFDEQAALVSADHPDVVEAYRIAHGIRVRGDDADTEELRQAFVQYRLLFDRLVTDRAGDAGRTDTAESARSAEAYESPRATDRPEGRT